MKAVLMAAGVGSRLGGAVEGPKCMLDVAGKPLILRTVEMLRKHDIDVAISVGYKKERIIKALDGLDVKFYFNPFYKVTNSMASLWFAKDHIDDNDDVILGNADVFWEENILDLLLSAREDAAMMVDIARAEDGDYFFKIKDRKIVDFGKDLPRNKRNCEYVGLAKLKASFLPGFKKRVDDCIENGVYDMWWENVLYNYLDEYPVYTVDVDGRFWGEIDYIEDYARILDYVRNMEARGKNMKLFTVGPVEMYQETLNESGLQLPYFRTAEFSEMLLRTEKMLTDLAHALDGSRVVFLTASGTGAMEASVLNLLNRQDKALVIDGGSFGHRFAQICERHGVPHAVLTLAFGETLTEDQLENVYTDDMTALLVNIHETSTGQLYDIHLLHDFCSRHGLFLIVDAISSFLADPIDMDKDGIDALIISSQKVLALAPGISMVLMTPKAIERMHVCGTDVLYFDFRTYLENGERGQTPFTPAVGVLLTLHSRLAQITHDGLDDTLAAVRGLALDFREKMKAFPASVQVPKYPLSNAMTPLYFRDGNAKQVYERLRSEYQINVTPNGGKLSDCLLRVGHIGALTREDTDQLIHALHEVISN